MKTLHIGEHLHWDFAGLQFNGDTLISVWIVSGIIVLLALLLRSRLSLDPQEKPRGAQNITELAVDSLSSIACSRLGEKGNRYLPLIATLFIFILFSNWFGIVPLNAVYELFFAHWLGEIPEIASPTGDLNVTIGLALIVFFAVHFVGLREKGLSYLKHFIEPYAIFLPLNIMEELAKPLSLSLRLFGNIFGKEVILLILASLLAFPFLYPVPIMLLGVLVGAIQAYIFALLATFYLAAAVEGHE